MRPQLIAEFIGTFILIFAGTGAIIITQLTGEPGHVGIAITFGSVVAALIYTFGHISGAHFNPAVTLAFWSIKETKTRTVPYYILAQVGGALLASGLLWLLFAPQGEMQELAYLGVTLPRYEVWHAFVMEFVLTFILMLVICGSAVHGRAVKSFAGLAIGLTVGLEAMFAGPVSGASMNPARSLAPALVSLHLEHLWIYLVATILGAVSAAHVYRASFHCKDGQCWPEKD